MAQELTHAMTLNGQSGSPDFRLIAGLIEGAINEVPVAWMEFTARDKKLDLSELVGTEMGFWIDDENGKRQRFWGTCISAEAKGAADGHGHYIAEIRPWLWFLTRARNNRIYQEMKATDIIREILGDYGFSGDLKVNHSGSDPQRTYCVQYRETDLDFIRRLMEEEGFYFYFEHEDDAVRMVLADQPGSHGAVTEDEKYRYVDERGDGSRERITRWELVEKAVTGKVTLRDYDFTKPGSDLTATSNLPSGSHGHKGYEAYLYPGGYTDVDEGEKRAAALVEAEAAGHKVWDAEGSIPNLNVGRLFEILDHPRHASAADNGFMVIRIAQFLRTRVEGAETVDSVLQAMRGISVASFQHFHTVFRAVMKATPFRMPLLTPRPVMPSIQTAIVTGPGGEEVAVDEYGRIKVQFHWDRKGERDDRSSCWVRTAMPWTGKNWGMIALPRIGQEVVIQFLEGDPDRPLCTGMLYNADTMPPYPLPADHTRTGIKTNSSKGGGGYNELMFDDKKGEELVRFEAEKDFVQTVQNQAHVRVGYPHGDDVRKAKAKADKSMKLEVKQHLDEIVEGGNHTFTVSSGEQVLKVKKDQTETIEGGVELTVTKDKKTTVEEGDVEESIKMGSKLTKLDMGDIKINVALGKIEMEAMQSITFKVGTSEVKLDQSGVTIKGVMVKSEGMAMLESKAPMTTVKGDAILTLQGGLTKIN
jgi:type VI secretion system secreted protein VgrG